MKKPIILLSLVFVVFLAGCTGTRVTSGTQGIIITSFSPDVTTTEPGVPVTFTLIVENKGEKTASKVLAQLFGLSNEWDPKPPITFSGITSLQGADVSAGIPGDIVSDDITLTPPKDKAADTTYDANVRVAYTYETIAEGLIKIATSDYLRSITPPGGKPSETFGVISSKTTGGPLAVNIRTRTSTIPSAATETVITFEVQNVGGGRAFGGELDTNPSITVLDTIQWSGTCSSTKPEKLVGSSSKVISCKITFPSTKTFIQVPVQLKITYNYFVDSSTSVTVLKTLGTGTTGVTGTPSGGTPSAAEIPTPDES